MAKRDINQLAKFITDVATGEVNDTNTNKKPDATVIGRAGGKVGGKARADKLTAEQRSAIAKKAAEKRWSNND
jgi:hypothetical protein